MSTAISVPLPSSNFAGSRKVVNPVRRGPLLCIRAAGNGEAKARNSLDHLRRVSKQPQQQQRQQHQEQPINRWVAPSAPVGLWDRFPAARTIQQMMETMDQLMEDPFIYPGNPVPSLSGNDSAARYRRGRTPWEAKEAEAEYKMRFDMPGMRKEDVRVWVEEKMLVIKAEKKAAEAGEEEDGWPAKSYGKYSMRIALPENVAVDNIKAEVRDGVLYVTVPKEKSVSKVLDIDVQ